MTAAVNGALYTPELLALAVSLANWPVDEALPLRGEARSRSCGSTVIFATAFGASGTIGKIGLRVSACAVGQAAAAIFAAHAERRSLAEIETALAEIEKWLTGEGDPPHWPDIETLAPARPYPGRHGAILLPWKAAAAALCKDCADG